MGKIATHTSHNTNRLSVEEVAPLHEENVDSHTRMGGLLECLKTVAS